MLLFENWLKKYVELSTTFLLFYPEYLELADETVYGLLATINTVQLNWKSKPIDGELLKLSNELVRRISSGLLEVNSQGTFQFSDGLGQKLFL